MWFFVLLSLSVFTWQSKSRMFHLDLTGYTVQLSFRETSRNHHSKTWPPVDTIFDSSINTYICFHILHHYIDSNFGLQLIWFSIRSQTIIFFHCKLLKLSSFIHWSYSINPFGTRFLCCTENNMCDESGTLIHFTWIIYLYRWRSRYYAWKWQIWKGDWYIDWFHVIFQVEKDVCFYDGGTKFLLL